MPETAGVTRDELRGRWSALHHGIDPTSMPFVGGWLRLMWAGGRVLHRAHVPPTAVTAAGVASAVAAVSLARTAPLPAAACVLGAVVCDGLDGAVAVVRDRPTRGGAIADAIADRCCDVAFATVLARSGTPAPLATAAAAGALSVDTLRRIRRVPAKVTVAERPTFAICAIVACLTTAISGHPWQYRLVGGVWVGATAVGLAQLVRTPVGPQR
ncbi:MAG: CDP-alcohol phosphatidyltransferase family protein [Jatrophihabitans sp.]|uniref:CDP-alcohol phosphatidyltransferase family protein n=1 Tax=Jatrophihabitans sp. TaxID=1932789 RepID=UPI003F7DDBA8